MLDLTTLKPGDIIEGGGIAVILKVTSSETALCRSLITGHESEWGNHCEVVAVTDLAQRLAEYGEYIRYDVPVVLRVIAQNEGEAFDIADEQVRNHLVLVDGVESFRLDPHDELCRVSP